MVAQRLVAGDVREAYGLVDFNEVKKNQAGDDPGQRVEHQYPQEPGPVCLSFFTLLLL